MNPSASPPDATHPPRSDRLDEAEIRIAMLDDQLDALNRTVFRQQQQIDLLTQAMVTLQTQMRSVDSGGGNNPRDEIPPHY
jgi:SlyX protein